MRTVFRGGCSRWHSSSNASKSNERKNVRNRTLNLSIDAHLCQAHTSSVLQSVYKCLECASVAYKRMHRRSLGSLILALHGFSFLGLLSDKGLIVEEIIQQNDNKKIRWLPEIWHVLMNMERHLKMNSN
jgi:hypothetical protein